MTTLATKSTLLPVSRFEAVLLRLLQSFFRPPAGAPVSLPVGRLAVPAGMSPECLFLVRDTLSKGCVQYLAKTGGWRREKHLRSGRPAEGRLWDRSPPPDLGLAFSRHSLSFLVWLVAGRPERPNSWEPPEEELTSADKFLLFLAYENVRGTEAAQSLRGRGPFARHGLIRLFFPQDFAGLSVQPTFDYAAWVEGVGGAIIEALQPRLQQRWLELERGKNQIGDWSKLCQLGIAQEQCLSAFLAEADAAKRPDLARFLLRAMAELLSPDLTPAFWIGGLQGNGPPRLADRLQTQREGLAVLRQIERLAEWTRRARGEGFLDEDYAIWQLWLGDWEQYRGDEIASIARNLLRQLEPLRVQSSAPINGDARLQKSEGKGQKSE